MTAHPSTRRRLLGRSARLAASLGLLLDAWPNTAWAGAGPGLDRPLRLILVYPPGGISDLIARSLAKLLSPRLKQPVLIEHLPGAGGQSGLEALARARPDGHTLAFSAITPLSLTPWLRRHGPGPGPSAALGLMPIAGVMHTPILLVGTPALGPDTLAATLQLARDKPQALRWATSGLGTNGHLVLEQLQLASGASFSHIPYKGGGQQLNDALSGQFELLSTNLAPLQLQYIRAGRLKPLAVGAPGPVHSLPDLPTFAALGYPQANLSSLFGIFGPPGMPEERADWLNAEINHALMQAELQAQLLTIDNLPAPGSRADFAKQIAEASARNRKLLEAGRLFTLP